MKYIFLVSNHSLISPIWHFGWTVKLIKCVILRFKHIQTTILGLSSWPGNDWSPLRSATQWQVMIKQDTRLEFFTSTMCFCFFDIFPLSVKCNLSAYVFVEVDLDYVAVFPRLCLMFCKACTMYTSETVDQSNCIQLPRDIICVPIGSQLLRSKILWMKHVVFWREPDAVIPHSTGDWLTGRWDSRQVLRHCHHLGKPQPAQDDVHHSSFDTAIQNQDFSRTFIENIQK